LGWTENELKKSASVQRKTLTDPQEAWRTTVQNHFNSLQESLPGSKTFRNEGWLKICTVLCSIIFVSPLYNWLFKADIFQYWCHSLTQRRTKIQLATSQAAWHALKLQAPSYHSSLYDQNMHLESHFNYHTALSSYLPWCTCCVFAFWWLVSIRVKRGSRNY